MNEYAVDVALSGEKLLPLFVDSHHCTVGVGVPVAAAEKLAVEPAVTLSEVGSEVIFGAAGAAAPTVSVAAVLVAESAKLRKTASNLSPFSAADAVKL